MSYVKWVEKKDKGQDNTASPGAEVAGVESDVSKAIASKGPPHRWKPGESGNPGGGRAKTKELATKIREFDDVLVRRLYEIATNESPRDATPAIKLLWAYGHGNPVQAVTGPDGAELRIGVVVLPPES